MSNSVAAQSMSPIVNETQNLQHNNEPPTLAMLTAIYAAQHRECWLCDGIAKKLGVGKEISEDDNWHFTSCVLSWEYLHRHS